MAAISGLTERNLERRFARASGMGIGTRSHVRACDRRYRELRDFVFTPMENPVVLEDSPVGMEETAEHDVLWSRIIELELVLHPKDVRPEVVRMDYDMPNGKLRVKGCAANAGYILRRWNVDCSPDHSHEGPEFALWLPDPRGLYGTSNAHLAPGYKDSRSDRRIKAL